MPTPNPDLILSPVLLLNQVRTLKQLNWRPTKTSSLSKLHIRSAIYISYISVMFCFSYHTLWSRSCDWLNYFSFAFKHSELFSLWVRGFNFAHCHIYYWIILELWGQNMSPGCQTFVKKEMHSSREFSIPCWSQASFFPDRRQALIPNGLRVRRCCTQDSSLCRLKEQLSAEYPAWLCSGSSLRSLWIGCTLVLLWFVEPSRSRSRLRTTSSGIYQNIMDSLENFL